METYQHHIDVIQPYIIEQFGSDMFFQEAINIKSLDHKQPEYQSLVEALLNLAHNHVLIDNENGSYMILEDKQMERYLIVNIAPFINSASTHILGYELHNRDRKKPFTISREAQWETFTLDHDSDQNSHYDVTTEGYKILADYGITICYEVNNVAYRVDVKRSQPNESDSNLHFDLHFTELIPSKDETPQNHSLTRMALSAIAPKFHMIWDRIQYLTNK